MPGGDGTGPAGMGPMSGRAAGFCAGFGVPGYRNAAPGRGARGWGGGGGRGWRHWFHATGLTGWQRAAYAPAAFGGTAYAAPVAPAMAGEQEIEMLKGQADYFGNALDAIQRRIEELEGNAREA